MKMTKPTVKELEDAIEKRAKRDAGIDEFNDSYNEKSERYADLGVD